MKSQNWFSSYKKIVGMYALQMNISDPLNYSLYRIISSDGEKFELDRIGMIPKEILFSGFMLVSKEDINNFYGKRISLGGSF